MKERTYKHPEFIKKIRMQSKGRRRFWIELVFDPAKKKKLLVILKNPSKANETVSDKTVSTVTKYVHRKRNSPELSDIGSIVILNLMPYYETHSKNLANLEKIDDPDNLATLRRFIGRHEKAIIAWGNHPRKLKPQYDELVDRALGLLKKHQRVVYYVDRITKLGHPKHGQVWGYENKLREWKRWSRP